MMSGDEKQMTAMLAVGAIIVVGFLGGICWILIKIF